MTLLEYTMARRARAFHIWRMTRNPHVWAWLLILDSAYHTLLRKEP